MIRFFTKKRKKTISERVRAKFMNEKYAEQTLHSLQVVHSSSKKSYFNHFWWCVCKLILVASEWTSNAAQRFAFQLSRSTLFFFPELWSRKWFFMLLYMSILRAASIQRLWERNKKEFRIIEAFLIWFRNCAEIVRFLTSMTPKFASSSYEHQSNIQNQ